MKCPSCSGTGWVYDGSETLSRTDAATLLAAIVVSKQLELKTFVRLHEHHWNRSPPGRLISRWSRA